MLSPGFYATMQGTVLLAQRPPHNPPPHLFKKVSIRFSIKSYQRGYPIDSICESIKSTTGLSFVLFTLTFIDPIGFRAHKVVCSALRRSKGSVAPQMVQLCRGHIVGSFVG